MKKIIQISATTDGTFCLTEDGKVYERRMKDRQEIKEAPSNDYPYGRVYIKGTFYWKEIPEEESF